MATVADISEYAGQIAESATGKTRRVGARPLA
jgi:hypothetical protein